MAGFAGQKDEFDATILRSLTLDDSNQFRTAGNDSVMDDDMMEIDDLTDILDQTYDGKYHTPDPEQNIEESSQEKINIGITPLNKLGQYMMSPFQSTPKSSQMYEDAEDTDSKNESTLENRNDNSIDITSGYSDQTVDQLEDQMADSESSFSSAFLSPTLLGARLAIGKPRLLLPAPDHEHDNEIKKTKEVFDFEYNTNSYSTSNRESSYDDERFDSYRSTPELRNRSKLKNTSSFFSNYNSRSFYLDNSENNDSPEEYVYNPAIQDYVNNENFLQNNALNKSYMYKQQMENLRNGNSLQSKLYQAENGSFSNTPIQIHHHHYYNSSHDSNNNNESNEIISTGIYNNANTSKDYNSLAETSNQQIVKQMDYNLPLPWESNSSPHEKVPYILASYLQLIINFGASFYALYLVSSAIKTVRMDISNKLAQHAALTMLEMQQCESSYYENYCGTEYESDILKRECSFWYKCMNQNPHESGNVSMVSAKTIGIIINSLIEPLGFKFFLILFGFIFFIFLCNFTSGFIRAKSYYGWDETEKASKESNST